MPDITPEALQCIKSLLYLHEIYPGLRVIQVDERALRKLYEQHGVSLNDLKER